MRRKRPLKIWKKKIWKTFTRSQKAKGSANIQVVNFREFLNENKPTVLWVFSFIMRHQPYM